jgi:hypothetical protein
MSDSKFVDFDDCSDNESDIPTIKSIEPKYDFNYEDHTTDYYKTLRKTKLDPFTLTDTNDKTSFKFYDMWDPYSGERIGKDPFGPLCFNPDNLIHIFHGKLLTNLWVAEIDEGAEGGVYEGYYDMLVGSGSDCYIAGRGSCPEKYIFRLPIPDCYLTKDHNPNIITLGPKFTDQEILDIERLAESQGQSYMNVYGKKRPSLSKMKYYYDQAISKTPSLIMDISKLTKTQLQEEYNKANRKAVDMLKLL